MMSSKHVAATLQLAASQDGLAARAQPMQPYLLPDRFQTLGPPIPHTSISGSEGIPCLPTLDFGARQADHDSGSPSTGALLESALISMPDTEPDSELDDRQLILAAAEVHFEDHAALRSHSVPSNKPVPSALKRSASHHTAAMEQRKAHPAMHSVASCHAGAMAEGRGLPLKTEQETCHMNPFAQDNAAFLHEAASQPFSC
jgi:hypothetical protein